MIQTIIGLTRRERGVGVSRDKIIGCLLGGAVGDALGGPIEFSSLDKIRDQFGQEGIRDFAPAYGRMGAITDDTQMTLFTAEGLIRARSRMLDRGTTMPVTLLYNAYLRWLATQGQIPKTDGFGFEVKNKNDLRPGWLSAIPELNTQRAPGETCLGALRSGRAGIIEEEPINNSKGCGGVMRAAPVGLAWPADEEKAFDYGCKSAAITHGHPSGYLAAGVLAVVISRVVAGTTLDAAIVSGLSRIEGLHQSKEVSSAVARALVEARRGSPCPEKLEALGEGWVAEEALAISIYCALTAANLEEGVILAVNHGGDSDSTGAITGNILGAIYGLTAIPERWLSQLELRHEIEQVAVDLHTYFHEPSFEPTDEDFLRYPPN